MTIVNEAGRSPIAPGGRHSKLPITLTLSTMLFVTTMGCGLFRPSVEEARTELARLIDPALDAGVGDADRPEGDANSHSCHEPVVGPENGIRPTLSYTFSWSVLEDGPEEFLERVANYWRGEGLEVRFDESENARFLFSGKDGYNIGASIVYDSMEADIGGSGPCVDNPAHE